MEVTPDAGGGEEAGSEGQRRSKRVPQRSRAEAATLAEQHRPLVRGEATKYRRCGVPPTIEITELSGAALAALYRAAEHWDPSRGLTFKQYASWLIRKAMQERVRQLDWASRDLRRERPDFDVLTNADTWAPQGRFGAKIEGADDPIVALGQSDRGAIDSTDPADVAEARDAWAFLLAELPPRDGQLLRWRFIEHATLRQISRRLGPGPRHGRHPSDSHVVHMINRALRNARALLGAS